MLSARGGNGGHGVGYGSRGGGGGGGGRVAMFAQALSNVGTAAAFVDGGEGGLDEADIAMNDTVTRPSGGRMRVALACC